MLTRQKRAERTRELILRAAAEVFERDGISAASLSWITRVADVSKGALYFHFGSKDELAGAVCLEGMGRMGSLVRECYRRRGPALERLATLCRELMRVVRDDVVVRAAIRLINDGRVNGASVGDPHRDWSRVVHRLLSTAMWQGGLPRGVDVEVLAYLLVSATVGVEMLSRTDPSWLDESVVGRVWETVFASSPLQGD
ncbi:ScbR family autoregulator-binding transcription factor [Actinopolyspora mortivallis]|uniref:TetR/AcrR family transcriptional regulator n=1 Tax=Actinopolyspora mortivallis TaxID=33906 RepID=A0A2T0GYM7_ACTMO|nr:ScbR family autoregulator-binding transcription factor [Actinopolyspora mortivallis]PRW64225.1 TetR/AcrR family transcriptional regulator [Actinopolyspora mortivallis]